MQSDQLLHDPAMPSLPGWAVPWYCKPKLIRSALFLSEQLITAREEQLIQHLYNSHKSSVSLGYLVTTGVAPRL